MITNVYSLVFGLVALHGMLVLPGPVLGQSASEKKLQVNVSPGQASKIGDGDSPETQRRSFAILLVTSLADEARTYQNEALRALILARAADTLWNADDLVARTLFRRAWEAAEKADADKQASSNNGSLPPMATALQRSSGRDLRAEVLGLAARRDRALGEEFLTKLAEQSKRETAETKRDSNGTDANDGWSSSNASIKRLLLARKLLEEGEIERAVQFAEPALDKVNANSIAFLTALRVKKPEVADQRFANLLSWSELDSESDANTVSGLSSYAFTPNVYVTFSADGGARWNQLEEIDTPLNPPTLPPALLDRFFRTASSVLLRPLPPPEQDFTSSGRIGKLMVVKRLLPLFQQYAPETAPVLRGQLTTLTSEPSKRTIGDDHSLLTQGLQRDRTAGELLEEMQERLDRAKTSRERDSIYMDAAARLANQNDARAQDLAAKIDDPTLCIQVGGYVDMHLIQLAIKKRQGTEVLRLAKAKHVSHTQRAWAYTQAARLLFESDRQQALQILEEAANEARRIDGSDPDRARSLVAVTAQLVTADRVRAWEIMAEAVKAANSALQFSGANTQLRYALATSSGLKLGSFGGADFGLSGVFRVFAKDDLYRSLDLAKSFKSEAPRATATLAVASQVLEQ